MSLQLAHYTGLTLERVSPSAAVEFLNGVSNQEGEVMPADMVVYMHNEHSEQISMVLEQFTEPRYDDGKCAQPRTLVKQRLTICATNLDVCLKAMIAVRGLFCCNSPFDTKM